MDGSGAFLRARAQMHDPPSGQTREPEAVREAGDSVRDPHSLSQLSHSLGTGQGSAPHLPHIRSLSLEATC